MKIRKTKSYIAILLSIVLVIGFIPGLNVWAEGEYNLWVNGVQFTSENASTGIACGEGKATYDATNNKLTLENATINVRSKYYVSETSYVIALLGIGSGISKLDIVLVGNNVIKDEDPGEGDYNAKGYAHGIYDNNDCDISISGSGSLVINDVNSGIDVGTYENHTSKLKIDSTSVEINSIYDYGCGIKVQGGISVNKSTLTVNSKSTGISQYSDEFFDVKDSTITINSVKSCIAVGDSVLKDGGVRFDNSTVKLNSDEKYGIALEKWYEGYIDEKGEYKEKPPVHTRKIIVKNGGSLEIKSGETKSEDGSTTTKYPATNLTDSKGQTDTTKIIIPTDSSFSSESGYGTDWSGNNIKISVGKNPVDESGSGSGNPTPTPTSGGSPSPTPAGGPTPTPEGATPEPGTTPQPDKDSTNPNASPSPAVEREKQMGEDGTALSKGASEEAADKYITEYDSEADPPGTQFSVLQARSTKTTKNSVTVTWKKAPGAVKYLVYASKCGKKNKPVKIADTKSTKYVLKKLDGKKISKGTYYKFIIVAVDKNNNVVSSSKTIHSATLGGKVGNCKKLTTKAKKDKVTVKAKKTFKLKPTQKAEKKKLKIKNHRKLMYESSDTSIATVNKSGVIKGLKKGKCTIYVYAQNGIFKKITVTVK